MKMKITTAKEQFDYAVWHVLNEIEKKRLPSPEKKEVNYMRNINVKHSARFLFGMEQDAIQFLKNEKVIDEIGEADIVEIGKKGTPKYEVYELHHFKVLEKYDEFYRKYTSLMRGGLDITQLFGFRGMIFWLKLVDGSEAPIDFSLKRGRKNPTQPYYLLRAFIEVIRQGEWRREGNWIKTSIKRERIIEEVKKLSYPEDDRLSGYWIANTRNNLVNKVLPENLKEYIDVGHYDHRSGTYTFSMKVAS